LIRPATREKILQIARDMGYQPHAGARLIKASRTRRWGVLLPNFSNPYYAKFFEALDAEARRRDTFVQSGLYHYNQQISEALVTYWSSGEVDGLIIDAGALAPTQLPRLKQMGFPVICVHSRPSDDFDLLVVDRALSIRQALKSLQLLGHRRVAHIGISMGGVAKLSISYTEWKDWMDQHGEGDLDTLHCVVENSGDGGLEAWKELRSRNVKFTAVLAYNDIIACGLIQAARLDGVRVPEDLSVVGNDDIDEGRRMGLTTMRHNLRLAATLIFKQLEARREGDSSPPVELKAESQFVMRDSVGPVPS
jgi:LacI family transcriptional regulator